MSREKENKLEEHVELVGNWYRAILMPGSILGFVKRVRKFDRNRGKEFSFGMTVLDYGMAGFSEGVRLIGYGYAAYKIYESLK